MAGDNGLVELVARPYLTNHKVQAFVLIVLFMSLVGAVTFFVIGLTLESGLDSELNLAERLRQNWWDIVHTLMLLVTTLGPVYFASIQEQRRRAEMGDFTNRVLVTMNGVRFVDGSPRLFMRSLAENSFAAVFADDMIQELVLQAKKDNMKSDDYYPLMKVGSKYNDWKRLRDHIKNKLSSIYTPGYIMRDVGAPTIEQEYTWALTHEKTDKEDFNDKFRILVVRSDLLDHMANQDYESAGVGPLEKVYDANQSQYFKERWAALRMMHRYKGVARKELILMETIKFTVPGSPSGERLGWQDWDPETSPESMSIVRELNQTTPLRSKPSSQVQVSVDVKA